MPRRAPARPGPVVVGAAQGFTLVSKDAEYGTGIDTGIDMEIEMTTM